MRWTPIDEHLVGDIVIVDLRDPHLMQLDPEGRLVERIRRLLSNGQTKIVINLTDLRDTEGLSCRHWGLRNPSRNNTQPREIPDEVHDCVEELAG